MSDLQTVHSDPSPPSLPLIFIVDDDPTIGMILEMALQMDNYRTVVFDNPLPALAAFRDSDPKPDLLITDYNMPGMTGVQLISECKALRASLKTILLSGVVDDGFVKSLNPQPDIFLKKPWSPAELLNDVKALLAE